MSLAAIAAVSTAGCTSALFTMAYLFRGTDAPAECNKLKDKRVVVVCRPVVALQYRNARVEHDLAEQVSGLLRKNVPKIKVIDHRKAAEWMDENTWDEYTQVGKALQADLVVGIDLEQFSLLQGQTLYQGRANVRVRVYDCKTGQLVFEKRPPQTVYPPNRVVQTSEKPEAEFRREFVRVLADQIARHFYDHDPHADIALDARSLE
jgi:hypothetical protein